MQITSPRLQKAQLIEEIICLAVLIALDKLPPEATLDDAGKYWVDLQGDCSQCPCFDKCLASIINE